MECLFEFYDGFTIKSNTILNSSNMSNEAFIIVTVLDAGTGGGSCTFHLIGLCFFFGVRSVKSPNLTIFVEPYTRPSPFDNFSSGSERCLVIVYLPPKKNQAKSPPVPATAYSRQ